MLVVTRSFQILSGSSLTSICHSVQRPADSSLAMMADATGRDVSNAMDIHSSWHIFQMYPVFTAIDPTCYSQLGLGKMFKTDQNAVQCSN